eukprot:6761971-Prymnesium_polylepis.1
MQQRVPKRLRRRDGEAVGLLNDEVVRAAIRFRVRRIARPIAVVQLRAPAGRRDERVHPGREDVGPRLPCLHTAALSLVVPPRVEQRVRVRDTGGLGVGVHIEKRLLVGLVILWAAVVERAIIGRVAEGAQREVRLPSKREATDGGEVVGGGGQAWTV